MPSPALRSRTVASVDQVPPSSSLARIMNADGVPSSYQCSNVDSSRPLLAPACASRMVLAYAFDSFGVVGV
jgi:hypothetical protein